MAGAGYKLFNTGDVLTAAQVNTYLQEQAVMRFANAAARTTALSGVLAEGMVSYLMDTDSVEVYNGTSWVGVASGDITSVTAGTGLSGGGTTGDVTLSLAVPVTEARGGTNQTTYTTGDLLYASGTNTLAKRGIGTTGQVLTVSGGVPTWSTPASGGAYTQLATGTFSGTVVTLSSISSSYQNLVLVISGATWGTGTNDIGIRFNNDATSIYKEYVTGARGTSGSAQNAEVWNASGENIGRVQLGSAWNNTNGKNHHVMTFKDYATAKYPVVEWQGVYENAAGFVSLGLGTWTYDSSSVISRLDIQTSATFTFTGGTYTLYGVK